MSLIRIGMPTTLIVNGTEHTLDLEPEMPLLWVLREALGLTGTKYGCGISACGACTVHLNGRAVHSCTLPLSAADGQQVTTIEGLGGSGALHTVQQAWIAHQVPQCGYCQSGVIMAVAGLLAQNPHPTDGEIDAELSNVCRCGTFVRMRAAIHDAATAGGGVPS
jgi:isoquinoline 1-oxidoreductase subunit alpha